MNHRGYRTWNGRIVMEDGTKIGIRAAADRLRTYPVSIFRAMEEVGNSYEDIKNFLYPEGLRETNRVAKLDPDLVYYLGSFSKGQQNHTQILLQLLGLDPSEADELQRRFPDA